MINFKARKKIDIDLIFCELYLVKGLFQNLVLEKFQGFLSLR